MPPRNAPPPAASDEIAQLRDEVTDLKNQVRVLSDILDEIREELQWVAQNGLPIREPLPPCPSLTRMALDPCADNWAERLVIDYGTPKRSNDLTDSRGEAAGPPPTVGTSTGKPLRGKLFAAPGEQRQLF